MIGNALVYILIMTTQQCQLFTRGVAHCVRVAEPTAAQGTVFARESDGTCFQTCEEAATCNFMNTCDYLSCDCSSIDCVSNSPSCSAFSCVYSCPGRC